MSNYFFGRYFKCCKNDRTIAFIPAYHRSGGIRTSSLQIVTDRAAFFLEYPYSEYENCKDGFGVRIGASRFSKDGITVRAEDDGHLCEADLRFGPFTGIKGDIMGPFRFLPFMQCRHSVYSMSHTVSGRVVLDGEKIDFDGGRGYIEGDRGRSFPERYVWTHAFSPDGASVMLSVATIPVGPVSFTGVIASVLHGGKEYRIATYKGAEAVRIANGEAVVRQKDLILSARLIRKNPYPLFAPVGGKMERTIRESASCLARYELKEGGKTVLAFETPRASFEYEYPN